MCIAKLCLAVGRGGVHDIVRKHRLWHGAMGVHEIVRKRLLVSYLYLSDMHAVYQGRLLGPQCLCHCWFSIAKLVSHRGSTTGDTWTDIAFLLYRQPVGDSCFG